MAKERATLGVTAAVNGFYSPTEARCSLQLWKQGEMKMYLHTKNEVLA